MSQAPFHMDVACERLQMRQALPSLAWSVSHGHCLPGVFSFRVMWTVTSEPSPGGDSGATGEKDEPQYPRSLVSESPQGAKLPHDEEHLL